MPSPQPRRGKKRKPKASPKPVHLPRADGYPPPLPGETRTAYAALCNYLDAPASSRSLRRVFVTPGRVAQSKAWSARYHWQQRATDFDAARRAIRLEVQIQREIERDLATAEHDDRAADLAAHLLFGGRPPDGDPADQPLLYALAHLARHGTVEFARIAAIQSLVDLSGISDRRKAKLQQLKASTVTQTQPAADLAQLVDALDARLTDAQVAAARSRPLVDDPPDPGPGPEPSDG